MWDEPYSSHKTDRYSDALVKERKRLRNYKKTSFFSLLIYILLLSMLLSGCADNGSQINTPSETQTDNGSQTSDPRESQIDNVKNFISYCAKEKSEENRIFLTYPQFEETGDNANELNEIIVGFIESILTGFCKEGFQGNLKDTPENWEWGSDKYTDWGIKIDYNIVRNDAEYFSVTFEGLAGHKKAAHPIHYFNSLTIDMKNGSAIALGDIYRIDDDFMKFFLEKVKEGTREGVARRYKTSPEKVPDRIVEYVLESFDENKLKHYKESFIEGSAYNRNFFITDEAIGISIVTIYAMGDYFEIYIGFEELEPYRLAIN